MSIKPRTRAGILLGMAGVLLWLPAAPARAGLLDCCGWQNCCGWQKCPPPYVHCIERPPCLKYKCLCPRPVCCPEELPAWGYFQTCWQPWPWPPSCAHCPSYAPAAGAPVPVAVSPGRREMPPAADNTLPEPRKPEASLLPGQ